MTIISHLMPTYLRALRYVTRDYNVNEITFISRIFKGIYEDLILSDFKAAKIFISQVFT